MYLGNIEAATHIEPVLDNKKKLTEVALTVYVVPAAGATQKSNPRIARKSFII